MRWGLWPGISSEITPEGGHRWFCFSPISREDLPCSSGSCCGPACPGPSHHGGHLPHLEAKTIKR